MAWIESCNVYYHKKSLLIPINTFKSLMSCCNCSHISQNVNGAKLPGINTSVRLHLDILYIVCITSVE